MLWFAGLSKLSHMAEMVGAFLDKIESNAEHDCFKQIPG